MPRLPGGAGVDFEAGRDRLKQLRPLHGLGDVAVHTSGQAAFPIAGHGVGRQSDNRQVAAGYGLAAAEATGGVEFYLIEQEGGRYPALETAERCLAAYKKMRA